MRLEQSSGLGTQGKYLSTRMLLWPPALCVALMLALPTNGVAKPSARYQLRPSTPVAGQPTTLDASRTACDVRPCTYRWSTLRARQSRRGRRLGGGKVLTHTFRRSEVRYVRLTVRNRKRQKSSKTRGSLSRKLPAPGSQPRPGAHRVAGAASRSSRSTAGLGWYRQFANSAADRSGVLPDRRVAQSVHRAGPYRQRQGLRHEYLRRRRRPRGH